MFFYSIINIILYYFFYFVQHYVRHYNSKLKLYILLSVRLVFTPRQACMAACQLLQTLVLCSARCQGCCIVKNVKKLLRSGSVHVCRSESVCAWGGVWGLVAVFVCKYIVCIAWTRIYICVCAWVYGIPITYHLTVKS